jgi:outer membrane autotransporter protein
MMRISINKLLSVLVGVLSLLPSEGKAAPCSFPLVQTVLQSCTALNISAGQTGVILNAGTILWDPIYQPAIWNSGHITQLNNYSTGVITGYIFNDNAAIDEVVNSGNISGDAFGLTNQGSGSIGSITNNVSGSFQGLWVGITNSASLNLLENSGLISGGTTAGISNGGNITSLVNNSGGVISGNSGPAYGIINLGNIANLNNSGNITGAQGGIRNYLGSFGTITNNSGGSIYGDLFGITNDPGMTINSVINQGSITGGSGGGGVVNFGTISNLFNEVGGSISAPNVGIANEGLISILTNNGNIGISSSLGLINSGTLNQLNNNSGAVINQLVNNTQGVLQSLTNIGIIQGGINNLGSINSLTNSQGQAAGILQYSGKLPTNYFVRISSIDSYGQLNASSPAGSMAFSIDSSSTVTQGTYTGVIQGFSTLTGFVSGTTGMYGGLNYYLLADTSVVGSWNLLFSSGTPGVVYGSTFEASNLGSSVNPVFSGGTLQMNQDNATYSQNFIVSNSTTNTIDQDGNTSTFTGVFSNAAGQAGNLIISNTGNGGKVIFTGANTYTGTTTITSGTDVAVNGSMLSSFIVNSGGTLQGSGSFGGGSINSGGILAPGNSIGTITSNGALTFASGSTYQVEVNSAGQSDKIVVNGAAAIQGGTVSVSGTTPAAAYLPTTKYTILSATNGVSGKFDSLSLGLGYTFLTPTLYYGSNDVTLGFALTPFSVVAKNINQRNVGNALTIAALGPVNSLGAPILNALFYGNYQNAQAIMDTVGGSGLAGVQSTAMQVGEMASSSVSDQIAFWRSGETMDATGRTSQEGNNPRSFLAYAPVQRNVPAKGPINIKGPTGNLSAAVAPRTFRAWGSMFGGGANYLSDAGRGAAASNVGFYGGLLGVDYQIQPNILVGVALGGSSSNFNVGSLSTNGNLTGFHAGVYGAYTMGNSYVALNETFSAYNNQTSRKAGGYSYLPYEQLSAQFGSTEFRTRAELGHGVLMGGLKATPFVAAEIAAYQSNAFSEQSSIYASTFALKNNGQGVNSLPTFAGLRLSNAVTLSNGWRLAPVGSVAYVHEFFPQRQFNNLLISMPSSDFNVAGPRSTYNLVQTKMGVQFNLNEKLALFTDFQGEFSPVSQSYGGKGGVKYVW